jgi:glycosyltransferase involved in cell wall biosynthesis
MGKNICLVIDGLNGNGGNRSLITLAQTLSKFNCRVDVIVLNGKGCPYPVDNQKFNLHIIEKITHPIKFIENMKRTKLLKDKVTSLGVSFNFFLANLSDSSLSCKQAKFPNVYHCIRTAISKDIEGHANRATGLSRTRRKIKSLIAKKKIFKGEKLIAISEGVMQDALIIGIEPKSIQVIYNPFDIDEIRQQSEAHRVNEQNYILHVGRFDHEQKRHDVLINAYKKSGIQNKLLLLGDDSNETSEKIKQLVYDLGLQDKVIFKGYKSNPYPYIKNAIAVISSSSYEGLSRISIESLVLRTPVVSTNCSGSSEILIDELSSFLSPIEDADTLGRNIKKMVGNPIEITDKFFDKFRDKESAKQYLALCN